MDLHLASVVVDLEMGNSVVHGAGPLGSVLRIGSRCGTFAAPIVSNNSEVS